MSGTISYRAPEIICWEPGILCEKHRCDQLLIHSPFLSLKSRLWRFSLHYLKDIFLFQIRSKTFTLADIFHFNVMIEQKDGSCVLNEDAKYVSCEMYVDKCGKYANYNMSLSEDEELISAEMFQLVISPSVFDKCFLKDEGIFVCTIWNKTYDATFFSVPCNFQETFLEASSQTDSLESIETLSENFKDLLTSGEHADVKIKVGKREFQAHRLVLTTRSPVLASMFSNDMLEKNSGILSILDCDEDAFDCFLSFLYSGKIQEVHSNKLAELYKISDKYDLPELKKECIKRFNIKMSVDLVCDALRVAILHQEGGLLENATNYFIGNVEEVLHSLEWEMFSNEYPKIANDLFKKYVKKVKK